MSPSFWKIEVPRFSSRSRVCMELWLSLPNSILPPTHKFCVIASRAPSSDRGRALHTMLLLHALWLSGTIPTVQIAPSVRMPFITLGGVNRSLYPDYPDYSNYSLWLQLGGRGFDSAWEYRTQGGIARAMVKSGITRSELFLTTKIPGSLHGGCCGCPGAGPPGTCLAKCHGVCFPASGHYTAKDATRYIREDLATLRNNGVGTSSPPAPRAVRLPRLSLQRLRRMQSGVRRNGGPHVGRSGSGSIRALAYQF